METKYSTSLSRLTIGTNVGGSITNISSTTYGTVREAAIHFCKFIVEKGFSPKSIKTEKLNDGRVFLYIEINPLNKEETLGGLISIEKYLYTANNKA